MSRDFRFRVWDRDHWVYDPRTEIGWGHPTAGVLSLMEFGKAIEQWTGLCDKNGATIYEGDLVKLEGIGPTIVAPVRWQDDEAQFVVVWKTRPESGKEGFDFPFPLRDLYRRCEVVGNVHEHSDRICS